eukprot:UN10204
MIILVFPIICFDFNYYFIYQHDTYELMINLTIFNIMLINIELILCYNIICYLIESQDYSEGMKLSQRTGWAVYGFCNNYLP